MCTSVTITFVCNFNSDYYHFVQFISVILQRFQNITQQVQAIHRSIGDRLIKIDNRIQLDPIDDEKFREKTFLINQVSEITNGVTDSMTELQEVCNSITEMKQFCQQSCQDTVTKVE